MNPELAREETTYIEMIQTQKIKLQNEISDKLSQIGTLKYSLPLKNDLSQNYSNLKETADYNYTYNLKP